MAENELPFDPLKMHDPNFKPPEITTPDVAEGWRCWSVSGDIPRYGRDPKLYSVAGTAGYYWVPRRESIAECAKGCDPEDVPGEKCSCGFYSAKTWEHLMGMSYHVYDGERSGMYCVVGQVANWGKVREGQLGWRAQKAYPTKLFLPYEIWKLAAPLERTYGVPVELKNWLKPQDVRYF